MLFLVGRGREQSLADQETSTDSDDDTQSRDSQESFPSLSVLNIRGEACHGLLRAVHRAKKCMDKLHNHDYHEALEQLVLSCYDSTLALGCLKHSSSKLHKAIVTIDGTTANLWEPHHRITLEMPRATAWASHAILSAYKETDVDFEMLSALEPGHLGYLMCERTSRAPGSIENSILWVSACGRFKLLWGFCTSPEFHYFCSQEQQAHNHSCRRAMGDATSNTDFSFASKRLRDSTQDRLRQTVLTMMKHRPDHPATLQAVRMWHHRVQQQEMRDPPAGLRLAPLTNQTIGLILPPSDDMLIGFESAIKMQDPSLAIQHLLICMYWKLMSCNGKPGPSMTRDLKGAATWVVELHTLLATSRMPPAGETLWEIVADRLVAAMLILARSFDLKKILGDHALLPLMMAEKKRMAELISKYAANPDADSDAASSTSDRSDSEAEHDCTQCNKRRKESEMHICYRCRRVIYCSKECMRKHAGQHKSDCMRMQLKNRKGRR